MAFGMMFLPKSCLEFRIGGVFGQQLLQQLRVEHVDAHRGQRHIGAARHGLGLARLLGEFRDAVPVGDGQHAEFARIGDGHFHHAHGDVGALLDVVGDHRTVVHLVDVVAGQHQHMLRMMRADVVEVLVDAVGGAAIPVLAHLLLRGHHVDELAEFAPQVAPAALHVLDQRLALVLREQADLADARVHAVGQHEIDDAELAAEGCRRFAAMFGEAAQALTAAAGHDHCQRAAGEAAHIPAGGSARNFAMHAILTTVHPELIRIATRHASQSSQRAGST